MIKNVSFYKFLPTISSKFFRTRPDRPTQPPVQRVPGLSQG
jgi:hypothetical protein